MNKRKKASSSASRSARGGHLLGPPRDAPRTGRNATHVTKSRGTRGSAADGRATESAERANLKPTSREAPGGSAIELSGECTVAEASALKERLAGFLGHPLPVTLDINSL